VNAVRLTSIGTSTLVKEVLLTTSNACMFACCGKHRVRFQMAVTSEAVFRGNSKLLKGSFVAMSVDRPLARTRSMPVDKKEAGAFTLCRSNTFVTSTSYKWHHSILAFWLRKQATHPLQHVLPMRDQLLLYEPRSWAALIHHQTRPSQARIHADADNWIFYDNQKPYELGVQRSRSRSRCCRRASTAVSRRLF
jgi:hypothetical protein